MFVFVSFRDASSLKNWWISGKTPKGQYLTVKHCQNKIFRNKGRGVKGLLEFFPYKACQLECVELCHGGGCGFDLGSSCILPKINTCFPAKILQRATVMILEQKSSVILSWNMVKWTSTILFEHLSLSHFGHRGNTFCQKSPKYY